MLKRYIYSLLCLSLLSISIHATIAEDKKLLRDAGINLMLEKAGLNKDSVEKTLEIFAQNPKVMEFINATGNLTGMQEIKSQLDEYRINSMPSSTALRAGVTGVATIYTGIKTIASFFALAKSFYNKNATWDLGLNCGKTGLLFIVSCILFGSARQEMSIAQMEAAITEEIKSLNDTISSTENTFYKVLQAEIKKALQAQGSVGIDNL